MPILSEGGFWALWSYFCLLITGHRKVNFILRALLRITPPQRKKNIREFLQLAEMKLGGYIRGQGLLCLAVGVTAFISYVLIGLPYTLVLAIFAGVMEMVPLFGPALGAVPALFVALSIDPSKAIWVVVATVLIQLLENAVLVPRIMKHSVGVNPIITLLSLIAFGSVFGFVGALLALPLAAIIQLLVSRVVLTAAVNSQKGSRERFADPIVDQRKPGLNADDFMKHPIKIPPFETYRRQTGWRFMPLRRSLTSF